MSKIILGDNPFFGVSHSGKNYNNSSSISHLDVFKSCEYNHINKFMISPHQNYFNFLNKVDSILQNDWDVTLVVPYPHAINEIIASKGFTGVLSLLQPFELIKVFHSILFQFLFNSKQSYTPAFKYIINVESQRFSKFRKFKLTRIALHNIVTDILIATKNIHILNGFVQCCKRLGFEPVIITQNPLRLMELYSGKYTSCFSYNQFGYMVNPSLDEVSTHLSSIKRSCVSIEAMQIFSSGKVKKDLFDPKFFKDFDNVIFGTTKSSNVDWISNAFS